MKLKNRKEMRQRRHRRVRRKVSGTAERPRLAICKSSRHVYVQLIDDVQGVTLVSATTAGTQDKQNIEQASELGRRAAEAALSKGIERVVVDRGGFRFHGRVKAIVDAATAAGLNIHSGTKAVAVVEDQKEES
jgi:large subunit ribosomal protein L18